MKSGKFLFLAIIFLVSLVCISAVSAADDAASDIAASSGDAVIEESISEDVSNVEVPNEEPILEESEKNILTQNEDEEEPVSSVAVGSFDTLNKDINNNDDSVIYLRYDYNYYYDYDNGQDLEYGIVIDRPLTIYGNGHTIDGKNQARIFNVLSSNVVFYDINFVNGKSESIGGAIYGSGGDGECVAINCTFTGNSAVYNGGAIIYGTAINCTFTNNHANECGGAMWGCRATNCTFTGNTALDGGALHSSIANNCNFTGNSADYGGAMDGNTANNCNFKDNRAATGGAIYDSTTTNCTFKDNVAYESGGAIYDGTAINCNFTGNHAENGGAMCFGTASNCDFNENSAYYGGAVSNGDVSNCTFTANSADYGGALYQSNAVNSIFTENFGVGNAVGGAIYNGNATNCTFTSNNAQYRGGAIYIGSAVNCIFIGNTANYGGAICGDMETGEHSTADSCIFNGDTCYLVTFYQPVLNAFNFISTYKDGQKLVVNITSSSDMPIANANIKVDIYTTAREFIGTYNILSGGWNVPLNAGNYIAVYNATDFDIDTVEGMIVIEKAKSAITSKAVTTVYNNNKYLVITLKDAYGKAISGAKVTVTLASAKTYTTDKNGQIKINIGTLVPKTYTAKISFAGNTNFLASSTTAKVVVKKATPKLTAKAKTFKVNVKTKKYTITLKNNKGKVMKKAKLTLKVGKKTYKATTNSKGKATFKITKLTKKGKYTAVIKYAGNKYYKGLSKKVKITVKK